MIAIIFGRQIGMLIKHCPKCKMDYPRTAEYFYKDKSRKDGFDSWCKRCQCIRQKEYGQRPEVKNHYKEYYKARDQKPEIKIHHREYRKKYRENSENRIRENERIKKWAHSKIGRISRIKKNYNITNEQAVRLIEKQDKNICEMCNGNNSDKKRLGIDHNHTSGKIRGVLCFDCNTRLGILENKKFVAKAKIYLEKYQ